MQKHSKTFGFKFRDEDYYPRTRDANFAECQGFSAMFRGYLKAEKPNPRNPDWLEWYRGDHHQWLTIAATRRPNLP